MAHLSIRAASFLAALCVERFCSLRDIHSPDIEAFCMYLKELATAKSLPSWDAQGVELAISGLGEPLPDTLQRFTNLADIVDAARELSASQMYGVWQPHLVEQFLAKTATLAGLDSRAVVERAALLQAPGRDGWGEPVSVSELNAWCAGA